MTRPNCREQILDATEAVLLERGAWRLTLEAVAAHAGVSKGGLLYHFPSKDDLLHGLVERLLDKGVERRRALRAAAPDDPGLCLRASIEACLLSEDRNPQLGAAIVGALAQSPRLMDAIRAHTAERFRELADLPLPRDEAALVLLAIDGLMLMEILNVSPFGEAERKKLIEAMIKVSRRLAQEGALAGRSG